MWWWQDKRVYKLILPTLLLLAVLDLAHALVVAKFTLALTIFAGVALVIRKLLLGPEIDMNVLAKMAEANSTGAGLVFLGVCLLTACIILAAAIYVG